MSWTERVADLAVRIAPEGRRGWALAVKAELAHIPAAQGLGFALGGLVSALGWRVSDARSLAVATR